MKPNEDITMRETAEVLKHSAEPMSGAVRADIKRRVMHSVRADARTGLFANVGRRVAVAMTVAGVLSGGVAYAAESSLPGEPFYPLKRAAENALVAILPEGELENRLLVSLAARRAEEAGELARNGAGAGLVDDAIGELRKAVRNATPPDGALLERDQIRIQESADGAPAATQEAIKSAVGATDSGPQGTSTPSGSGSMTPDDSPGTPSGDGDCTSGSDTESGCDTGSGSGSEPTPDSSGSQTGDSSGDQTGKQ
ncbi:MAG: hypothetical protein JXA36_05925 [Coriobacteriia bacterium]|nr:hypothetical protein [Coriobacteriia bacterium]